MTSSRQPTVVIVTRPGSAGQRLTTQLARHGHEAVWWPAFQIGPAPDVEAARSMLERVGDYDLALFVSANAVRAAAPLLSAAWPQHTIIGAVGASTRAAIEAELRPDAEVTLVAPDDKSESGSEAFWSVWQMQGRRVQSVLLVRADDGRDWLTERFVESGAVVDVVATYSRRPHRLSADDMARSHEWISSGVQQAIVFSSSEAVAALDDQVDAATRRWLRTGTAVATHERIAQRLVAAGYPRVISATFDDDSLIAKLESIRGSR